MELGPLLAELTSTLDSICISMEQQQQERTRRQQGTLTQAHHLRVTSPTVGVTGGSQRVGQLWCTTLYQDEPEWPRALVRLYAGRCLSRG